MTYRVTFSRAIDEALPTVQVFADGFFGLGVQKRWQLRANNQVICSSARFQAPDRPSLMNDNER